VVATSSGGKSAVRLAVREGEGKDGVAHSEDVRGEDVAGTAAVASAPAAAAAPAPAGEDEEDDEDNETDEECPALVPTPAPWTRLALTAAERAVLLPLAELSVVVGDIFEAPAPGPDGPVSAWWDDGDVVYAASLLFGDAEMSLLAERACLLRAGSVVISLKPFPSPCMSPSGADAGAEADADAGAGAGASSSGGSGSDSKRRRLVLVETAFYKMSWAMAKVYFYMVR
jgi:hypothetical protein